jgi:hypothetical protein
MNIPIPILAAIIGAVIGSTIAGGVSYLVSRKAIKNSFALIRLQERNRALATFRNAFLPELIFLKHNTRISGISASNDLYEFLFSAYVTRHVEAFEAYRNHLSTEEKANIDRVWQEYCCNPDNPETLCFEQYSRKGTDRGHEADSKKLALERIEAILKCAKPIKEHL